MFKVKVKDKRVKALLSTLGLGLILGGNVSQAAIYDRSGNKLPDIEVNSSDVNWQLLEAEAGQKYNGVGALESNGSIFCTAFFINTQGKDNAPAYAVTNGHCSEGVGMFIGANEVVTNRPSEKVLKLNYFADRTVPVRPIGVRRIVYATMKNTDIAILELNTTFQQLIKEGFQPLTLEQAPVKTGKTVTVVGVPMSDVHPAKTFLHAATCTLGEVVKLREDVYQWNQSIRNRCSLVGGMSGSPVISLEGDRVVAIANTGVNDDAMEQPECSLNRPCEVSAEGKIATLPEENYAQKVSNIPSCFNSNGVFDLNTRNCQLEKPAYRRTRLRRP